MNLRFWPALLRSFLKAVRDEVFIKLLMAIACQHMCLDGHIYFVPAIFLLTNFSWRRKHHIYLKSVTTTRIVDGDGDLACSFIVLLFSILFLVIAGLKSKLFVCYPFSQMCVNHEILLSSLSLYLSIYAWFSVISYRVKYSFMYSILVVKSETIIE